MRDIGANRRKKKSYGGIIFLIITIGVIITLICFAVYALSNANKDLGKIIYPVKYEEYVEQSAAEYNLDKALVYAIIKTESNFNPNANSDAGAMGLMQIMPDTFEWLQHRKSGEVTMDSEYLYNPEINIEYGCRLLRFLLDKFSDENTAVAAYNAGFGAVEGWLTDSEYSHDGITLYNIPYEETENYVDRVENAKKNYEEQ